MSPLKLILLFALFQYVHSQGQNVPSIIEKEDFEFLKKMTKDVMDSSRLLPGQEATPDFGPNKSGGTLIRPGGRNTYPAYWIRDYAMSLESGFVNIKEQKHMLIYTAQGQSNHTWITKKGGMVPYGAIPDHILIKSGVPIYYPGTYDPELQGSKAYGVIPPYCDQFYFVHMAYYFVTGSKNLKILTSEIKGMKIIDRLELAFRVPASRTDNEIVTTTEDFRAVDFGFRDAITITGDLCFASLLKYVAAKELAELFEKLNKKAKADKYRHIAALLKNAIPVLFLHQKGMLKASNGIGNQPDVWSTAYAIYLNVLEGAQAEKAAKLLADAFQKGSLAHKGNIRHILKEDDFSETSAWQTTPVPKNVYQNGAYWGTPTGWVAYSIATVNVGYAKQLVKEYVSELRENDYRKGPGFGAPYECFFPPATTSGPVYLTSVALPYSVFNKISGLRK